MPLGNCTDKSLYQYAKKDKTILCTKPALPPTRDKRAWLVGVGGLAQPWPRDDDLSAKSGRWRGICAPACSRRPLPGLARHQQKAIVSRSV